MQLFLENGYFDMKSVLAEKYPFTFILGGRGTGKTYGMVEQIARPDFPSPAYKRRVYLRRTQTELDLLNNEELSPFKRYDADTGTCTTFPPISKYVKGIDVDGEMRGLTLALSTISNIRGFDGSDIDRCFYDEFIPEKHARPMRGEAEAFAQCYETINRNRELLGEDPLQMVCCANANRADNPIFMEWGLIKVVERMKNTERRTWSNDRRGILIVLLDDSPISKAKQTTALYRATRGSDFADMSLQNSFAFDDFSQIRPQKLIEYRPYVAIGEICIYQHKSQELYYVSEHLSGSPDHYGVTERELTAYRLRHWRLWNRYIDGELLFENYLTKALFIRYTYK